MPDDLFLELATARPVAGRLESLDEQAQAFETLWGIYLRGVSAAVEGIKGSVRTFESIWGRVVQAVARGQTAEMQAARSRLIEAFEARLDMLGRAQRLAVRLRSADRGPRRRPTASCADSPPPCTWSPTSPATPACGPWAASWS